MKKPRKVRACWVCGCTDAHGCPEGCWWVAPDLCSSCSTMGPAIAAYAAALHDAGVGTWVELAAAVKAAGLGVMDYRLLARVACKWRRENVAPAGRRKILQLLRAERRA